MRKNYIYFMALFILSVSAFAQKITLTPTVVNGRSVSGGPIDLGGTPNSTVSLNVTVEMPNIPGNSGTLNIYSLNGLNANIVSGGTGGALFFGEGKSASRSFVVNLNWSSFATSGSYIYAEYKTSGSVVYKSSYMAVIKNASMNGGTPQIPADAPDPSKIPNTLCCNQTVRLGDKPALITGSQYLNPYDKESFGINTSWAANGNPNVKFLDVDYVNKTLAIDHVNELGSFTITRGLGYNSKNDFPNKSNTVTITVVPSPISINTISTNDAFLNSDGYYEISSVKTINLTGYSSMVNLNILEDPNHISKRGDNLVYLDSYRWEYKNNKLPSNPWITIPNEFNGNLNFSDPSKLSNFEDTYYLVRRVAIYKNISKISNEIKILVRGLRFNNTICCDQILKITPPSTFESPQIIKGSTVTVDRPIEEGQNFTVHSITYQWQSQDIADYPSSTWTDIPNATSKDYLPSQPLTIGLNRRGKYSFEKEYKYRRVTSVNYSVITNRIVVATATSYSNETSLNGTLSQADIQLYPNPASSILNIECTVDISDSQVTISNIMGTIVNSNNFSVLNPKLISINVSNLTTGTYFITIQNPNLGIAQKTFIKQ